MKTTLIISDATMRKVRHEATRRQTTISALVEAALRTAIEPKPQASRLSLLPEFSGGGLRVDVANRNALLDAMDETCLP